MIRRSVFEIKLALSNAGYTARSKLVLSVILIVVSCASGPGRQLYLFAPLHAMIIVMITVIIVAVN